MEGGYFALNDRYSAAVTDTDTITTSVAYAGGRKSVEDYGRGGGEKLTGIEQAIDGMVERIEWKKDDG